MIPAKGEKLNITSSSDNMRLVERLVEDVCDVFNVNEDSYGNILIAVTEAVNNAIYHGNQGNPEKKIKIGFESGDKNICFSVADEGAGFDHASLPDPTDPINIDKPNGRGVFLMKNLADKVEFNNNGQEVCLTFNVN
ncbi:MAG: Serine-protein kinase RsbW [Bacteroidetes bacterium]|jgi:serine/threonine-protein kinase RsbW|nr:Serine-protein kinase RsbW [Bacteroidota bacterium]MDF2453038.1 Serine-protein kinase RsbW [Bacteroidota bacterium]